MGNVRRIRFMRVKTPSTNLEMCRRMLGVVRRVSQLWLFGSLRFWLVVITLVIVAFKLVIISYPWPGDPPEACINPPFGDCGFVFDEAHYVPAVRKLLMGTAANNEHPPLSKALMMLGILIFGDNPYGWRLFITLAAAACIYLVGMLAYELSHNKKISIFASLLFGFDITSFNIGSIAILDGPALMFSLLGTLFLLRGRFIASGIALGLAALSKTSSLFVIFGLLLYVFLKYLCETRNMRLALKKWVKVFELVAFTAAIVTISGLAVYDYGYGEYATPFEHLAYIWNYHSILTFGPEDVGNVQMPLTWSLPVMQFPKSPLYVIGVIVDGKEYHPIAYYALQTPLWWMTWLVVGYSAYLVYSGLRAQRFPGMELFILSWFAANYLVYFPIAHILHRWVYAFYFYMTVPVIAIGFPLILVGSRENEYVLCAMTMAQIAWFFVHFPVKAEWYVDLLLALGIPA